MFLPHREYCLQYVDQSVNPGEDNCRYLLWGTYATHKCNVWEKRAFSLFCSRWYTYLPVVPETISLGKWQRRATCCVIYFGLLTLNGDSGWRKHVHRLYMRHFSVVWSLWLCIRMCRNNIKIFLVHAMMAYRECRSIAPLVLNIGARCWQVVTITPRQPFISGLGVLCKMKLQSDILISLDNKMIFMFRHTNWRR